MNVGSKLQMIITQVRVWYSAITGILKLIDIIEKENLGLFSLSNKGFSWGALLPNSSCYSQQGLFRISLWITSAFVHGSCFGMAPGCWSIFLLWNRAVTLGSRTQAYHRVGWVDWVLRPWFPCSSIDLCNTDGPNLCLWFYYEYVDSKNKDLIGLDH